MAPLEELIRGVHLKRIHPKGLAIVLAEQCFRPLAFELTHKEPSGRLKKEKLYYSREPTLGIFTKDRPCNFDEESGVAKYLTNPFQKEPDCVLTSVNDELIQLLNRVRDGV